MFSWAKLLSKTDITTMKCSWSSCKKIPSSLIKNHTWDNTKKSWKRSYIGYCKIHSPVKVTANDNEFLDKRSKSGCIQ